MPKESTHLYLAKNLFDGLCIKEGAQTDYPAAAEVLATAPNLFMLGAVAPDSVFNYIRGGAISVFRHYSSYSHDSSGHNLFGFLPRMAESKLPVIPSLSFALGAICHLTADTVFHPMIYYFTGNDNPGEKQAAIRHYRFETGLDQKLRLLFPELKKALMYHHIRGMEFSSEEFAAALKTIHLPEDAADLVDQTDLLSMFNQHARHESYYGKRFFSILARLLDPLTGFSGELPALFFRDIPGTADKKQVRDFMDKPVEFRYPAGGQVKTASFKQLQHDFTSLFIKQLAPIENELAKRSDSKPEWEILLPAFEMLAPHNPNTGLPSPFSGGDNHETPMTEFCIRSFEQIWE